MRLSVIACIAALSSVALADTAKPTPTQAPPASAPTRVAAPCMMRGVKDMGCVPGGVFLRGSNRGPKSTRPQAEVWIDTFYMDTTEVTVAAYDACVARGACEKARTIYEDYSRPRQPKVGVSWQHADRFCRENGKHLPTEAEWEKAARGTDGRLYPWGDEKATCKHAVIKDHRGRSCGVKKRGTSRDTGRTFEVASRAANQYGLYDMSGNAWEWVADWYSASYARCGKACTGENPKGPCAGAAACRGHFERVVRGGSWYWEAEYATTIARRAHAPENKPYHHYGFRCAASIPEAMLLAMNTPDPGK